MKQPLSIWWMTWAGRWTVGIWFPPDFPGHLSSFQHHISWYPSGSAFGDGTLGHCFAIVAVLPTKVGFRSWWWGSAAWVVGQRNLTGFLLAPPPHSLLHLHETAEWDHPICRWHSALSNTSNWSQKGCRNLNQYLEAVLEWVWANKMMLNSNRW